MSTIVPWTEKAPVKRDSPEYRKVMDRIYRYLTSEMHPPRKQAA